MCSRVEIKYLADLLANAKIMVLLFKFLKATELGGKKAARK